MVEALFGFTELEAEPRHLLRGEGGALNVSGRACRFAQTDGEKESDIGLTAAGRAPTPFELVSKPLGVQGSV